MKSSAWDHVEEVEAGWSSVGKDDVAMDNVVVEGVGGVGGWQSLRWRS